MILDIQCDFLNASNILLSFEQARPTVWIRLCKL